MYQETITVLQDDPHWVMKALSTLRTVLMIASWVLGRSFQIIFFILSVIFKLSFIPLALILSPFTMMTKGPHAMTTTLLFLGDDEE
jgi:hypothetical protein